LSFLRAALLAMLAALPAVAGAECVMTMRMVDDPPYFILHADGPPTGLHADIAREALRRIGCRLDFREVPFTRSLKELEEGKLDIVPDLFLTPERERYTLYSRTRSRVPNRLFVRAADRERWQIHDFADLPRLGIRLGIETGALISPDFAAISADPAFKAILSTAHTHTGLWHMLETGRVDAVVLDELAAKRELVAEGLNGKIAATDFVTSGEAAYFGFSRATVGEDQRDRFDDAVAAMHKDGTMTRILAGYGLAAGAAIDLSE